MSDDESIKKIGKEEEKRKMQGEQEEIEEGIKPGHVEDMLIISLCVVAESISYLLHLLYVNKVREVR